MVATAPEWLLYTAYAFGYAFFIGLFAIFTYIIVQAARTR